MKPTISVIVPVYNVEAYLRECLDSIVNQTYQNLQIILVDDGSTDKSGAICDEYKEKDSRVHVIHKKNGGQAEARNAGLTCANGDYVTSVDSDDFIIPQTYELVASISEKENADVIIFNYTQTESQLSHEPTLNGEVSIFNGRTDFEKIISLSGVVIWNKVYKKKCLEGFSYPVGNMHEDEYIHRLMYKCTKVAFVQEKMYYYRIRQGSTMNVFKEIRVTRALEAFEDRIRFAQEKDWKELLRPAVNRYAGYCVDEYFIVKKLNDKKYSYLMKHLKKCLSEKINEFGAEMFWKQYVAFNCGIVPYKLFMWLNKWYRTVWKYI